VTFGSGIVSIVTISRGSYSRGKEVAEQLARELGYDCVSREIILEASEESNVPETTLMRAVHDAPSVVERFTRGDERYVSFVLAALLRHAQRDNLVYHGLAGHFLLREVPGVLKVRIISDIEDRVREAMRRDGTSTKQARYTIERDDEARRRWGLHLYGADTWDSELYNMVLNIKTMTVPDAVGTILRAVQLPAFQTTSQTREIMDELLAATGTATS
jgi:cytidylate kinase